MIYKLYLIKAVKTKQKEPDEILDVQGESYDSELFDNPSPDTHTTTATNTHRPQEATTFHRATVTQMFDWKCT